MGLTVDSAHGEIRAESP